MRGTSGNSLRANNDLILKIHCAEKINFVVFDNDDDVGICRESRWWSNFGKSLARTKTNQHRDDNPIEIAEEMCAKNYSPQQIFFIFVLSSESSQKLQRWVKIRMNLNVCCEKRFFLAINWNAMNFNEIYFLFYSRLEAMTITSMNE